MSIPILAEQKLLSHKLRRTSKRLEILEIFLSHRRNAISNQDIEDKVTDIDRITLYRTLKSFVKHGLIHEVVDGNGKVKFALCEDNCDHSHHHDNHAHFHCQKCGHTICVNGDINSDLKIPVGYKVNKTSLIVEGLCAKCN